MVTNGQERTQAFPHRHVVALVVLVVVVGATFVAQFSGPVAVPTLFRSGDTTAVIRGADVAADCLREGTVTSCGQPSEPLQQGAFRVPTSRVLWFATLLYVPAIAVNLLGFGQEVSLVFIGILNALAFVLLAALPWLIGERLKGLHRFRLLWAVFILCGLLLPYGVANWSECLAAALVAGTVAGVAARWPAWAVGLLAFGAGLSKDPMFLFVILLAFAVAGTGSSTPAGLRERIRPLVPVLVGSAAAVVANSAFNVLRFGTIRNITLLSPVLRVTRVGDIFRQLIALVVSPNGGVVFFWPTALVPLAVGVVVFLRADTDTRVRLGVVALATGGFFLSLAMWFSPFGWHAWGPRLSIPILPAAVLATFVVVGERPVVPPAVWALAAVAVIVSVPNVAVLGAQDEVSEFMTAPSTCRDGTSLPDPFASCMMTMASRRPWLVPDVVSGLGSPLVAALAALDVGVGVVFAASGLARSRRAPLEGVLRHVRRSLG